MQTQHMNPLSRGTMGGPLVGMEYYRFFDVTNYFGGKGILLSSSNQFEKLIIQRTIMESFIVISFVVSEKKRGDQNIPKNAPCEILQG